MKYTQHHIDPLDHNLYAERDVVFHKRLNWHIAPATRTYGYAATSIHKIATTVTMSTFSLFSNNYEDVRMPATASITLRFEYMRHT